MKEKYIRIELGTGFCGETSVEYRRLEDQTKTTLDKEDWDAYQELALSHAESYGRDWGWYCEDNELDPDEDIDSWDNYCIDICESGYIEIVEADPDDEDDSTFCDGFLEDYEW